MISQAQVLPPRDNSTGRFLSRAEYVQRDKAAARARADADAERAERAQARRRAAKRRSRVEAAPLKKYAYGPEGLRANHGPLSSASPGYSAGRVITSEGRASAEGAGFAHTVAHRTVLVNQAREFYRDNPLYRGLIDRAVDYIIGTGFMLQSNANSKTWRETVETLWRQEYAPEPETRGLWTLPQLEQLVCRDYLNVGGIGAKKIGGKERIRAVRGKLQLKESEQITGDGIEGVALDRYGRPVTYYLADYDKHGNLKSRKSQVKPCPAVDFLHVANLARASDVRGTPALTASFPTLHRINDVCDSEALAWQILSRFAVAINRQDGPQGLPNLGETDDDDHKNSSDLDGDLSRKVLDIDYATLFFGGPGETVQGISHNIPGQNFPQSLQMFLRLLGLPLGMPLELALLDWSKGNYSGHRAALEQAFRVFVNHQTTLQLRFYAPLYRWKVDQWVAEGRLTDRDDKYLHAWIAPSFPWLDMLKEVQAWGERIDRGLATHARALKALNLDPDVEREARLKEIDRAIQDAAKLNKQHPGANVDWRTLVGLRPKTVGAPDTTQQAPADDGWQGDKAGKEADE